MLGSEGQGAVSWPSRGATGRDRNRETGALCLWWGPGHPSRDTVETHRREGGREGRGRRKRKYKK